MTSGVLIKVAAPIHAYQASHAEVEKVTCGNTADGMLFHVTRVTDAGFEVFEVGCRNRRQFQPRESC